jgi:hypothetical protein
MEGHQKMTQVHEGSPKNDSGSWRVIKKLLRSWRVIKNDSGSWRVIKKLLRFMEGHQKMTHVHGGSSKNDSGSRRIIKK